MSLTREVDWLKRGPKDTQDIFEVARDADELLSGRQEDDAGWDDNVQAVLLGPVEDFKVQHLTRESKIKLGIMLYGEVNKFGCELFAGIKSRKLIDRLKDRRDEVYRDDASGYVKRVIDGVSSKEISFYPVQIAWVNWSEDRMGALIFAVAKSNKDYFPSLVVADQDKQGLSNGEIGENEKGAFVVVRLDGCRIQRTVLDAIEGNIHGLIEQAMTSTFEVVSLGAEGGVEDISS